MAQNVKTVQGLAVASVNLIGGLSIGSAKSILGLDNTAAGGGYLVDEDFEAPGYENTWNDSGTGTITPNYNTAPAPLEALYSLRLLGVTQQPRTYVAFTAQSEVWAFLMFREVTPESGRIIAQIQDSGGTGLLTVEHRTSDDAWILRSPGGSTQVTSGSFPSGTTYYIWLHFRKGVANAFASLGISTTTTEPVSGSGFVSLSNGTSNVDASRLMLGQAFGNGSFDWIFDKVRVKSSAIGNNPS